MTANLQQYRLEGNRLFQLKKYEEAIKQYTKAINKGPSTAVFYSNRALCYLKLKNWEQVVSDCKLALENDNQSVKGNFFMGEAELELEKYEDAISHLTRAHELAKQQKLNYGDDITYMLRMAKHKRWDKSEKERVKQEIELQTYLNNLILNDQEKELEKVKKKKKKSGSGEKSANDKEIEQIKLNFDNKIKEVNSMFQQVDDRRKTRDVPDFLCGKISFSLMRDPVITPSGITYDRKDLEDHLQRVGHFDPVTRHELKVNQLIPNLAMKEVISDYIENNQWVEEF